jgi:hypothetical protein
MHVLNVTQADTPYDLDRNHCPVLIHNRGATGACAVNLPTNPKGGEVVDAVAIAAQDITLDPGDSASITASDGSSYAEQTDGLTIIGDAGGESIRLVYDAEGATWMSVRQLDAAGAGEFSEVTS